MSDNWQLPERLPPKLIQVTKFSLMAIFVVVVVLFGRSVMQVNTYLN